MCYEVQNYLDLRFPKPEAICLPLPDEPHVSRWEMYAQQAKVHGVFPILKNHLYCLHFPVQEGVSQKANYRAARLQGIMPSPANEGLSLQSPDSLCLRLHQSIAGTIPVIIADNRADFILLAQAFAFKNEPVMIPDSMGACMVAGYNNWDRVRAYREQWVANNPGQCSEAQWQAEFKLLIAQKHLYQDRFIVLHDGPYSGVLASEMGLDEAEWRALSLKIRLEHECTHYFTKRVFGLMRRDIFDELLADYAGIVAALGTFNADWFLRFMGLESFPHYREGGRLQNYLDKTVLQSDNFIEIQKQVVAAARNLERFDAIARQAHRDVPGQAFMLLAITRFTLEELAAEEAPDLLCQALQNLEKQGVG